MASGPENHRRQAAAGCTTNLEHRGHSDTSAAVVPMNCCLCILKPKIQNRVSLNLSANSCKKNLAVIMSSCELYRHIPFLFREPCSLPSRLLSFASSLLPLQLLCLLSGQVCYSHGSSSAFRRSSERSSSAPQSGPCVRPACELFSSPRLIISNVLYAT